RSKIPSVTGAQASGPGFNSTRNGHSLANSAHGPDPLACCRRAGLTVLLDPSRGYPVPIVPILAEPPWPVAAATAGYTCGDLHPPGNAWPRRSTSSNRAQADSRSAVPGLTPPPGPDGC